MLRQPSLPLPISGRQRITDFISEFTRDALAGIQEALNQPNDAKVPFMITQAQKEALRAKGFDDDQIANMTPEKAHQLLGSLPPLPY